MVTNYLKTALRNLWKNKVFSSVNIIGLAAGLAVCLLIILYVVDEVSYDKYNRNAGRIFRVGMSWWVFGIATVAALMIAFITVSFQTIKAATANPVKSLRTE